jgi:hypothetical protein
MTKERATLAVLLTILMLTPSALANGATTKVENAGNALMAAARELIAKNTCKSLDLAKQNVEAYESLRESHPGELSSREAALKEIDSLVTKYCTVATDGRIVVVYNNAPIATGNGGGVTCGACSGADPSEFAGDLGSCTGCAKPDPITLAVLYMSDRARSKFINSADPELRDKISNFENSNPTTVARINAVKLQIEASGRPETPLEFPGKTIPNVRDRAGTFPNPSTDKPVIIGPTIIPGTVTTPTPGSTTIPSPIKKP